MVDLDHFKAYNDAHGHQEGDRLLIETTVAWSRQLRGSDMLVRYGGEEFAVLLPNCGLSEGRDTLERLATMMPSEQTFSAGVAVTDGSEDREQIIARVDAALYEAKRGGRNRVVAS
jgi:diguanylate cyclase (GGDEF)-like protein